MNQSQMLVDQNNQYMLSHVSTTPGLNHSASSSASSTPSSSCSSGQARAPTIIGNDFDFFECANTINLVDRNLMNLNMTEFHQLNQNGNVSGGGSQQQTGDMAEEYWCANFNQYVNHPTTAGGYADVSGGQVVMMPPPAPLASSSSTPSSSSPSPSSGAASAPKRGGSRSKKKLDNAQCAMAYQELNAPKPPLTGYQHYFKERQSELRSQDASLKFADIVKKVGTDWSKNIDKETKNKFIIKGLQDKERYKNELKAYQSNLNEQQQQQTAVASPKLCKKEIKNEPDECKLAHLHTPPPSNDSCSPTSQSPNWLNDCCLFTHKDYFNLDAYHSKIIERSLLTQNEIKYLKQKLQQFKLDNKKLNQMHKNFKCDLDKKHSHVTEFSKSNVALKSQLSMFKSLVHSSLLNPLVYQQQQQQGSQPPASTTPNNSLQYQMAYPNQVYQQYNNQSPQQQQQQQYYMDSASVYNQQIQLQLQQNQYPGQYYQQNNIYIQQQQQQQQQYMQTNGEIYQDGWISSQVRSAYEDPNQYAQYIQQQQQQQQQQHVYQQHQSSQNQNSLQTSTTS